MTTTKQLGGSARVLAAAAVILAGAALLLGVLPTAKAQAETAALKTYIVVFQATQPQEGQFQLGGNLAANKAAALDLIRNAGGTVTADLTAETGVAIVDSANAAFAETVSASELVAVVGEDFSWKGLPSQDELLSGGVISPSATTAAAGGGGAEPSADPLESQQWDMRMIRTEQAHALQAGWNEVEVAVVDSGIDVTHVDFMDPTGQVTNVDCLKSKDFVVLVGPGIGTPVPCQDNLFHGTHVAGTIAAQANGVGIVGVAPNVTLISIKVCDSAEGYCYASSSVAGIAYAGSIQAEVMNMSFFVDDDALRVSTELKCDSDPKQRAFKEAVNRSIKYARGQGVTPVAAAGNSQTDLGASSTCSVVPTESPGVMSVSALGNASRISSYSSYGKPEGEGGMVAAPGGDGAIGTSWCNVQVFSTIPGQAYGCFQGTSMASPHVAGVAALIVSRIGSLGGDGDVVSNPNIVMYSLAKTAVDIGAVGYDRCYGSGRVDALRAASKQSTAVRDDTVPACTR